MQRATFILAIVCGILTAPLLCDAGIAAHECACDEADCCADETECELDPCNLVYEAKGQRDQDAGAAVVSTPFVIGIDYSSPRVSVAITPMMHTSSNIPFASSDMPLRI